MAKSFHQRMREAAKLRRSTIQDTRRQIAKAYEKAMEELNDKAAGAKSKLTQRWADTYIGEMRARVHELWKQVGDLTEAGMHKAAGSAVGAQVDLLSDAADLMGLDMRGRFAATFARTPDEAVASVLQGGLYKGKQAGLSRRIWNNEALQAGRIEEAIVQALAQQDGGAKLARALRGFVREDAEGGSNVYDLFDPDKASYNARRLATTAINHAYWSATLMTAEGNPYAEFLHWELSAVGTHCPYCIDYASHDEGLGIGNWPLDSAPLPHPWCTCLWYVDSAKSLDQIGKELYRWQQGESNPKMDGAFGVWQGTAPTGGTTGAKKHLTQEDEAKRQQNFADQYYEAVRNRQHDAERIALNTGWRWKKKAVEEIRQHVFLKEHFLDGSYQRFGTDYDQAMAWKRLLEGKEIKDTDLVFLRHEYVELTQMRLHGYTYDQAHAIADKKHPWYNMIQEGGSGDVVADQDDRGG